MEIKQEMRSIINRLMDDGDEDRQGWASYTAVFNLDKLFRDYCKEIANSYTGSYNTAKGWWFMDLASHIPLYQNVRSAIEILVDIAKYKPQQFIILSESLCDVYQDAIAKLLEEITEPTPGV